MRKLEAVVGPLIEDEAAQVDAPEGLAAFAAEAGLTSTDVDTLARLRIRGQAPQSKERWAFIYQAMLASEYMDSNATSYDSAATRRRRKTSP